ncbi:MAG: 30S ribosomal protein S16 [Planctomycetes bacterium]|nr:30S ribosomal protein S16 [Planctomycetota bacterium]
MAVKIRMKRIGRTNRPFYRINAVDSRSARDGRVIEELGSYDPHGSDDKKVRLNAERVQYWLSVGAQPSETVRSFLKKAGLLGSASKPQA